MANDPGDYRVKCDNPNRAMTAGALDIEGDDPSGLLRYARYTSFTEGFDFDASPFDTHPRNSGHPDLADAAVPLYHFEEKGTFEPWQTRCQGCSWLIIFMC